jgi:hypothetical protein
MNNSFKISFLNGITITIPENIQKEYLVVFSDSNKQVVYQTKIYGGMWANVPLKYYDRWSVQVFCDDQLLAKEYNDLKNKRVKISVDTASVSDVLSIIDLIDRFQKYHECSMDCIVSDDDLSRTLYKAFPNISFYSTDIDSKNYHAAYKIARFEDYAFVAKYSHPDGDFRKIAMDILGFDIPVEKEEPITVIIAHPNNPTVVDVLKSTLKTIKTKIILSVNHTVDEEVQKLCDYVVYDKDNPLLRYSEYGEYKVGFFFTLPDGTIKDFEFEHSYAVYQLIKNGLEMAKSLGYKKVHYYNYDCIISEETLKEQLELLNTHDCVVYTEFGGRLNNDVKSYEPAFFGANIDKVLPFFRKYKTKWEYYIGGAGIAPCAFFDIKISHGFENIMKLNVKELSWRKLVSENKINTVKIDTAQIKASDSAN